MISRLMQSQDMMGSLMANLKDFSSMLSAVAEDAALIAAQRIERETLYHWTDDKGRCYAVYVDVKGDGPDGEIRRPDLKVKKRVFYTKVSLIHGTGSIRVRMYRLAEHSSRSLGLFGRMFAYGRGIDWDSIRDYWSEGNEEMIRELVIEYGDRAEGVYGYSPAGPNIQR